MNAARLASPALALLLALTPACDSDSPASPAEDATPLTDELSPDTFAPDVPEDDTATPPDVVLVDPLPVAATFDAAYASLGDAVVTTLVETLAPRYGYATYVTADGAMRVPPADFGAVEGQPGEPHHLRDQLALPASVDASALVAGALPAGSRSLFYGLVLSDVQLVDADSPSQVAKNSISTAAGFPLPAHRPHGEFAAHLADAVIQTTARFAEPRPFDAALILGDAIENGQANELSWFLTLLGGGELSVDSGARDDLVPGPANDAFDPFVAAGLPAGTPWVAALGNHDFQVNGNFPHGLINDLYALDPSVLELVRDVLTSFDLTLPEVATAAHHNAWFPHALRAAFAVHPDAWFSPDQLPDTDVLASLEPADIPADAAREGLDACSFVAALHAAPGLPAGHGLSDDALTHCTPWYTWDPVDGLPLRFLVLALGPLGTGGDQGVLARPSENGVLRDDLVGDPRFDQIAFLDAELARAADDDVALIVLSHQPSWTVQTTSGVGRLRVLGALDPSVSVLLDRWISDPVEPLSATDLRQRLAASGHVIAHLAGHTHDNDVRAICPDGTALASSDAETRCAPGDDGATGYWEATTAAVVDFPHQARFVEIVHIADRLAALYLTIADPRLPAQSLASHGRFISRAELARDGQRGGAGAPLDRNLLLPFALPEGVAARWAAAAAGPRIESESTLAETREPLTDAPAAP